ncbi:hypothetical protein D3C87_777530 [compost metagenome]
MEYTIPCKLMPKKRPQAGRGAVFMPREYQRWKQTVRDALAVFAPAPTLAPVAIGVKIRGPSRGRGDVRAQRALEAVTTLEERLAMSPGCLIGDDAQVKEILYFRWVKAKEYSVTIRLEELPEAAVSPGRPSKSE